MVSEFEDDCENQLCVTAFPTSKLVFQTRLPQDDVHLIIMIKSPVSTLELTETQNHWTAQP